MASRRLVSSLLRSASRLRAAASPVAPLPRPSPARYLFNRAAPPTPPPATGRTGGGRITDEFTGAGAGAIRQPFPPSGSGIVADMGLRQSFDNYNFVRQENRAKAQANFNNPDNVAAMPRTANGERPFSSREGFLFSFSPGFTKDHEQYSKKKRDFVHVWLKRKKTFVTVTDCSGNKKTGASAGCLEDRKGRSRLSRYASEAVAEHVGRSARKMGLSSVVMKVKGASFFKKKKKVILSFAAGFRGERVRDRSPVMYVQDVTQLPHNGCRLRKQRRV